MSFDAARKPAFDPPQETKIRVESHELHAPESFVDELGAAVGGAIVDHHDFVGRVRGERPLDVGKILGQRVAAIPSWG